MPCSGWRGISPRHARRERAPQPPELLEVGLGEGLEALAPGRRELEADNAVVLGISDPLDQFGGVSPVDQPDRTVVTEEEIVGDLAHGRSTSIGMPADGKQQLMLRRRQSRRFRLLLTPAEEPT